MRFEPTASTEPTVLVFPGQGAHSTQMLAPFAHAPSFAAHHERVKSLLGFDPSQEVIDQNAVSSLLTVLASVAALELLRGAGIRPVAAGGYSVGQWTALYAAEAISVDDLFTIVHARARLMDEHIGSAGPTGMLSVIGVKAADVADVCEKVGRAGENIQLTNDNAPGQVTLGGSIRGLELAAERLAELKPKRVQRVPVAGAWHSRYLEAVVPKLEARLMEIELRPGSLPIADNSTGGWLPEDQGQRRAALARQVAAPVLWRQCVVTMAAKSATQFLEVGYGDVLTKFGFFIDRRVRHEAVAPSPRP